MSEEQKTISAGFNGAQHEFASGTTVLEAARALEIDIPTLCNDERLKPVGDCRLCLVKIEGFSHPVASCMTALHDGMQIETHTPELETARQTMLRMLARNYPLADFKRFPEKHFHQLAAQYKLDQSDFCTEPTSTQTDGSHPYIQVDMSRCIDCYRCVRICDEVQGQFVWQVVGRGAETRIVPGIGKSLKESACVSCGACVDTCPTGALEDKSVLEKGAPVAWTKTVCPYCGTGCEMLVGTREDKIVEVKPDPKAPVNRGHLCVKGRYAFDFVDAADRVTEPMIRIAGEWKVVSWNEALGFAAKKMRKIVERNGKQSVGVLGSARATNEENYLAQKFARVCLETNNVDCCARVCHTPTAAAMKMTLGTGAATNSFNDIELAKTILVCGANPTENHPVVGARIKQAVLKRGVKLIVIDPRKIELAKYAAVHLRLRPGTNIPLLNALAHAIIEENLADEKFIGERVSEFEEFRAFVKDYSPEKVAEICGVEAELIRRAARIYAKETPSMCFHGLGITEHTQGTEGVICLVNLALLTGNLGRRGAGVNPLRGQNNVQGSAQMGCDPGILTGSIALDEGRAHFENIWNAKVPTEKGLNLLQMIDAARDGKLKAIWSIGYDIFLTLADAKATEKALRSLELVIVQDMFLNETAKEFAHVFFPAASSFEKSGTFMNADRHVQRVRQTIEPRGNARSDWEIIRDLARAMGKGAFFNFNSAEEIWNEVRAVWKNANGITYARLEKESLQWNCPDEDHSGTEVLHVDSFAHGKRAALRQIKYRPTKEIISQEFPFILTTGRTLYHFNAGTMTERTPNIELRPSDLLVISPFDAEKLKIENGENIRLKSKYGEAVLPVEISSKIKTGELFATFHTAQIFLNRVTSPFRDRFVQAPEYKVTAVRLEKLSDY